MTDIPEDVMKLARETALEIAAGVFGNGDARYVVEHGYKDIARALIADRAAQAERMARMEEALKPFFAASEAHKAAVDRYNARLIVVRGERERGDWSSKVDAYSKAVDDAARDFYKEAEKLRAARSLSQEGSEPS